jgi:hypothetical protein
MTTTPEPEGTLVNEVDMAEVLGALELAAKVYRAVGDPVMADHYTEVLVRLSAT